MATLYMLIGVPGSGKTTWLNQKYDISLGDFIVGSDYIIQEVADQFDISYNEAFPHLIKFAEHMMYKEINNAKMQDANIYWDQTNTSRKTRAEKIAKIPESYHKVAVYFKTPDDLEERLASRIGKTIPEHVVKSMIDKLEEPTHDEGFDEIIYA